jgi:elongator complex protein 3
MELRYICKKILEEARKQKVRDLKSFNSVKLNVLRKLNCSIIPKNGTIASVASGEKDGELKSLLSMKPVRTISGVAPIALMTDPYPCPHSIKGIGPCTYCPGGPGSSFGDVPQSYTGKEPSTKRAIRNHYDPYLGVFNRLEHYIAMNSVPEKCEVILQGGTFPFSPKIYQDYFVKYLLKAMNDFSKIFYGEDGLNVSRFNEFFEMPADVKDSDRTNRIQKKLFYIKNLDLSEKKNIDLVNGTFFNNFMQNKKNYEKNVSIRLDSVKNEDYNFEDNLIHISNKYDPNPNINSMKTVINKVNDLNNDSITLEQVQKENETSRIRCIGLTIETKSDYGKLIHGNQMLRLGCTRIEIGIQSIYNEVLEKTNRGNTVEDNIDSIRILKDLGFKINAHYMPGLPYTTRMMDRIGLKSLFDDPEYRPDMLKIYPCMVLAGTKLYDDWKSGVFTPLTTKQAAELIAEMFSYVPEWVRVMRVQRDIPTYATAAGVDKTNLRQYVDIICKERNISSRDIRAREAGINNLKVSSIKKISLNIIKYDASKGKEYFIEAEDKVKDILIGYCRLRFPSQSLRPEITDTTALIRELHVYSEAVSIGKRSENSFQHRGIGKSLMERAEKIAKDNKKNKIVVIAGIGAREYFKKIGYFHDGPYMSKFL